MSAETLVLVWRSPSFAVNFLLKGSFDVLVRSTWGGAKENLFVGSTKRIPWLCCGIDLLRIWDEDEGLYLHC